MPPEASEVGPSTGLEGDLKGIVGMHLGWDSSGVWHMSSLAAKPRRLARPESLQGLVCCYEQRLFLTGGFG